MDELTKAEIARLHDEEARQNHRLEDLEGKFAQLNDIALSVKELATNMAHMVTAQQDMRRDIEEIKAKPASMWEKAVWTVIGALIAAAVAALMRGAL